MSRNDARRRLRSGFVLVVGIPRAMVVPPIDRAKLLVLDQRKIEPRPKYFLRRGTTFRIGFSSLLPPYNPPLGHTSAPNSGKIPLGT
jgi:hypothetical protein